MIECDLASRCEYSSCHHQLCEFDVFQSFFLTETEVAAAVAVPVLDVIFGEVSFESAMSWMSRDMCAFVSLIPSMRERERPRGRESVCVYEIR